MNIVISDFSAHVVMLCECGEVDIGLADLWDQKMKVFCTTLLPEHDLRVWSSMRKEIIHHPIW